MTVKQTPPLTMLQLEQLLMPQRIQDVFLSSAHMLRGQVTHTLSP